MLLKKKFSYQDKIDIFRDKKTASIENCCLEFILKNSGDHHVVEMLFAKKKALIAELNDSLGILSKGIDIIIRNEKDLGRVIYFISKIIDDRIQDIKNLFCNVDKEEL